MNAPENLPPAPTTRVDPPALYLLAMALLAQPEGEGAEAQWLLAQAENTSVASFALWQSAPPTQDLRLHALGQAFGLSAIEIVAVALAAAVEADPMLGRVLAWLQAPTGGTRPSVGLLLALADLLDLTGALENLVAGPARACGLLILDDETRPLPEQLLRVALPNVLALRCGDGNWPGIRIGHAPPGTAAPSLQREAARQADALCPANRAQPSGTDGARMGRPGYTGENDAMQALVVRSGHPGEAQTAAWLLARQLGRRPAFIEGEPPPGLAPWLWLRGVMPVLCCELAPGETRRLPALPGYSGPLLIACGIDGSFEREGVRVGDWRVPLPLPEERVAFWKTHLDPASAEHLGRAHRHVPAQIDALAHAARHQALLADEALAERHVALATRSGAAGELGNLAQLVPDAVPEDALVMPPDLQSALAALRQRCIRREGLADALGPSARTRYHPGVRALYVGASGTGKTLAAAWLATRLGLPLYRVDLATVASKYIGETEKNLAQLFARAEHAEVVLLFDEADALFGKRTDVKDANDRFANQQTNYLLQRIESFDGITLLTSNSRSRFDAAFTRRLDSIIEFPMPGPQERRALWLAHLGHHHALDDAQVNRVAAACDLAGGHIRNATLAAASVDPGPVVYAHLRAAIEAEYRKLGRLAPAGL